MAISTLIKFSAILILRNSFKDFMKIINIRMKKIKGIHKMGTVRWFLEASLSIQLKMVTFAINFSRFSKIWLLTNQKLIGTSSMISFLKIKGKNIRNIQRFRHFLLKRYNLNLRINHYSKMKRKKFLLLRIKLNRTNLCRQLLKR